MFSRSAALQAIVARTSIDRQRASAVVEKPVVSITQVDISRNTHGGKNLNDIVAVMHVGDT